MRPGTMHYVITIKPSFVQGSHFLAQVTIIMSINSFVHSFFQDNIITNTTHHSCLIMYTTMLGNWLEQFPKQLKGEQIDSPDFYFDSNESFSLR